MICFSVFIHVCCELKTMSSLTTVEHTQPEKSAWVYWQGCGPFSTTSKMKKLLKIARVILKGNKNVRMLAIPNWPQFIA